MVLNNKPQLFTFFFPSTFWYPEVVQKWTPLIERMKLPYMDLSDFMNAQVQQVRFPGANLQMSMQGREQYEIMYPAGKELETEVNKTLSITFKLTESYLSYWVLWDQVDLYLHYSSEHTEHKDCWFEPVTLGFLTDQGIQMLEFTFKHLTPTNLGELNLSYAATVATYNTFTFDLHYNWFSVK